jgi:hypothetical protein
MSLANILNILYLLTAASSHIPPNGNHNPPNHNLHNKPSQHPGLLHTSLQIPNASHQKSKQKNKPWYLGSGWTKLTNLQHQRSLRGTARTRQSSEASTPTPD